MDMKSKSKSMLEYSKEVLTKLSFDARLFNAELKKSLSWLNELDRIELNKWYKAEYAYIRKE